MIIPTLFALAALAALPGEADLAHQDVVQRLADIAAAHPDTARVVVLGASTGGREIPALVIDRAGPLSGGRPGLLLTGDLDGRRTGDARVLIEVAERLLARPAEELGALDHHALIVVPRPNPDGAEELFGAGGPGREQAGNGRPDDADRDGRSDEDGPDDLDGDGVIGWMRVPDPEGEWVPDEHDPRAMRKARRQRGERGTHKLMLEGRDADGDGEIAEDDAGGVQPDRNFPAGWQEHDPLSGTHPLSEPESRLLARLVLDNPGLGVVLVVGGQDTLVSLPAKAKDIKRGGFRNRIQAPLTGVHADDLKTHEELKRRFEQIGADEDEPYEHEVKAPSLVDGSLHAWAYHQAGRLALALKTWTPPTDFPDDEQDGGDTDDDEDGDGDEDEDEDGDDEEHQAGEDGEAPAAADPADRGGEAPRARGKAGKRRDKREDADERENDADSPVPAAVLAWLDAEHDGAGFLPWTPFDHPDLGAVELGGLAPGVLVNPPPDELEGIVGKLEAFVRELLDAMPRVAFESIEVKRSAPGLFVLEAALVNTGVLPTATRLGAETDMTRPLRVTLELPDGAELMNGPTQVLIDRLAGGGDRHELRWVISAASGDSITLRADADTVADIAQELTLP